MRRLQQVPLATSRSHVDSKRIVLTQQTLANMAKDKSQRFVGGRILSDIVARENEASASLPSTTPQAPMPPPASAPEDASGAEDMGSLVDGMNFHSLHATGQQSQRSQPSRHPQLNSGEVCPLHRLDKIAQSKCKAQLRASKVYLIGNRPNKICVEFTPKASATYAAKVVFDYLNLTETAFRYDSRWIHTWRSKVYDKSPEGRFSACNKACLDPEYTCMKIVRNPYARAVSSYVYILTMWKDQTRRNMLQRLSRGKHRELYTRYVKADVSFREWLTLLSLVSAGEIRAMRAASHFLPQYVLAVVTAADPIRPFSAM